MPTPTYIPLATVSLASTDASVSFSSLPASYRDLIIVYNGTGSGTYSIELNGDISSIYSRVFAVGNGSTTSSGTSTFGYFRLVGFSANPVAIISQLLDYSTSDKHKTLLNRGNDASAEVNMLAARWASTSVVTSLRVFSTGGSFNSGSTISIYGVN